MARIRRTASIAAILKRANYKLAHSTCSPDSRFGMIDMLRAILVDAGLYGGYGYITTENMKENEMDSELPGVRYVDSRTGDEVEPGRYFAELSDRRERGLPVNGGRIKREFPDESRRFYYVVAAIAIEYRKLEKDGEKGFGARGRAPSGRWSVYG